MVPRIVALLRDYQRPAYRRAAAFTLSQMLAVEGGNATKIIVSHLHDSFLNVGSSTGSTVTTALNTLTTLLTNSDPSPKLITSLLSPIVPSLYSLLFHLDSIKTSSPEIKETVRGLLVTWSRIVSASDAVEILWSIFDQEAGQWHSDMDGDIQRITG